MSAMTLPIHETDAPLDDHGLASVTFNFAWSDGLVRHQDQLHVEKFSAWREADLLPPAIGNRVAGMRSGEEHRAAIAGADYLGAWNSSRVARAATTKFDRSHRRGMTVEPRLGRFYPQGFFHGVHGIFPDAVLPARIVELDAERMAIDLNHPMARFSGELSMRVEQVLPGFDRRGGRCTSPLDDLLQFTGLAATLPAGGETDFGDRGDGLARPDDRSDRFFYSLPRLVQHLDERALGTLNRLYRHLIPQHAEVLDLMASFDSHLQGVRPAALHLLGMNAAELDANKVAQRREVRDLNETPDLPFAESSLDAVVCTASIEYLTHPREVLAECLRVLRPGGVLIVGFSNRWFPTKAIRVWGEMQEFERVGMVTQWLARAGFDDLNTFSSSGWPRPLDDAHAGQTLLSDPVYAVWGQKPA